MEKTYRINTLPTAEQSTPPPPPNGETFISALHVGNFIVYHTHSGLRFALREPYTWLGETPDAPSCVFLSETTPIPPFTSSAADLPQFELNIAIDEGSEQLVMEWLTGIGSKTCNENTKELIKTRIREKIEEFLLESTHAGLLFGPSKARCAWQTVSGTYWLPSVPQLCGQKVSRLEAGILTAHAVDANLYLKLELSAAPYKVTYAGLSPVPRGWEAVIEKPEVFQSGGSPTLHKFTVGDPVSLTANRRGFRLRDCGEHQPDVWRDSGGRESEFSVTSLKDIAADGIYRLGERLVVNEYRHGAATLNRLYQSEQGLPPVVSNITDLFGTRITALVESLRAHAAALSGDVTAYAFNSDGVWALAPGAGGLREVQHLSRLRLKGAEYLWPTAGSLIFITEDDETVELKGSGVTVMQEKILLPVDSSRSHGLTFALGDIFGIKKVREIRLIYDDGAYYPFEVYGALREGRWHLLGRSRSNAMRLRGSGWRIYRLVVGSGKPPAYVRFIF